MTTNKTPMTSKEVTARFNELNQKEKRFEIQDEFFADNVKSIEPSGSPYFGYAEGKSSVRKKAEEFVKKIQDFHGAYTTQPVTGGNHFSVGRGIEITVEGFGRIKIDQIMLYEVKNGQIISEQFFY